MKKQFKTNNNLALMKAVISGDKETARRLMNRKKKYKDFSTAHYTIYSNDNVVKRDCPDIMTLQEMQEDAGNYYATITIDVREHKEPKVEIPEEPADGNGIKRISGMIIS